MTAELSSSKSSSHVVPAQISVTYGRDCKRRCRSVAPGQPALSQFPSPSDELLLSKLISPNSGSRSKFRSAARCATCSATRTTRMQHFRNPGSHASKHPEGGSHITACGMDVISGTLFFSLCTGCVEPDQLRMEATRNGQGKVTSWRRPAAR